MWKGRMGAGWEALAWHLSETESGSDAGFAAVTWPYYDTSGE